MKIRRKMLHPSLRPYYWPLKLLGAVLSAKWGLPLAASLARFSVGANIEGLQCAERHIPSRHNGPDIRLRIFSPVNHGGALPALLYLHGGGYAMGCPEWDLPMIERFIQERPCVVVAPAYRLSFAAPYPAACDDAYDSLLWLRDHAETLGALSEKFIVAGQSAGGGLAAAVTLRARDTGDANVALQIPIYPMIDDLQSTKGMQNNNAPGWTAKATSIAWKLYLHDLGARRTHVPPYAAPARNVDFAGLPPTISFVGDLDPLAEETIDYMRSLSDAGTQVAFTVFAGGFHSFENLCPKAEISQQANRFLLGRFAEFVDEIFGASKSGPGKR